MFNTQVPKEENVASAPPGFQQALFEMLILVHMLCLVFEPKTHVVAAMVARWERLAVHAGHFVRLLVIGIVDNRIYA